MRLRPLKWHSFATALTAALLLVGCATTAPTRTAPPLSAETQAERQRERAEWLSLYST